MERYVEEERTASLFAVLAVYAVSAVFVLFGSVESCQRRGRLGGLYTFCFLFINHHPAILPPPSPALALPNQ